MNLFAVLWVSYHLALPLRSLHSLLPQRKACEFLDLPVLLSGHRSGLIEIRQPQQL
ncbi:hypothetical protein [Synechococcus sp. UW140]|uniref:hypothetical protein n=1 Tax=Synechococcus sp. UW140 TaxID=368503 RepID=UPI0025E6ED86|nr:hypothetical protein [Synechococcus sp. UW140]